MPTKAQLDDYNSEPVKYCSKCYSLGIRYEEHIDLDFCTNCGCSDILETSIDEWERLWEGRYGKKYIEKNSNPQLAYLNTLTDKELMKVLYGTKECKGIALRLYPDFPKGLLKMDTVLILFERLRKDRRLDELKLILTDYVDI